MALTARIDQIKTDDLEPTITITVPPTPRPFALPATHVCRLTGAVISAERADVYAAILNAGGDNSMFILASKLADILDAMTAAGADVSAVTAAITGTDADPDSWTPDDEIADWVTRSTALSTGRSKNVTGSGHDAGGESV